MKKTKSMTVEEARELVSNQSLWPLVRDFLWDFSPQIHESWLEGLQTSGFENLNSSPRVKRYILSSLGIKPCFHDFPKEDLSRVLLLDAATLESVAKWLGALACVESLRRVTDGATVRKLKSSLSGVYPEVFGYTAYFKNLVSSEAADLRGEDIAADVAEKGYGLLFSVFSVFPESIVSRVRFKLPKNLRISASPREVDPSVVSKLLKLKFPEAYKLCCS